MEWETSWMLCPIQGSLHVFCYSILTRAFMNAQEKRAEQLKSLGIEEAEISTNVIQSTGGKMKIQKKYYILGAKKKGGGAAGDGKKEEPKKEDIKFDPITPDSLMLGKAFGKANKKFSKVAF